jgi:hypothetical protein
MKNILNPQALTSLYGEFPSFIGGFIHFVKLARDDPRISINIQLDKLPERRPAKWGSACNSVYIELSFIGVSSLKINDWHGSNVIKNFSIKESGSHASVYIDAEDKTEISFLCEWIRVERVTAGIADH